jgi:catechol 2,3-dioxygenase-like lactoylglutathione lyase family enzyme
MDYRGGSEAKLPPVFQVGIVVNDMDTAIDYYCSVFGWGPFKVRDLEMKGAIYKGRTVDCRFRIGSARQPGVEIELIQPLEGDTPYADFLREGGEGLHHLGVKVDDLDETLASLAGHGIRPVFSHSYPEIGLAFAYLDTDRVGGVMLELIQMRRRARDTK